VEKKNLRKGSGARKALRRGRGKQRKVLGLAASRLFDRARRYLWDDDAGKKTTAGRGTATTGRRDALMVHHYGTALNWEARLQKEESANLPGGEREHQVKSKIILAAGMSIEDGSE